MQRGGVVAEIGVHRGDYAAQILWTARPDQLILIDPYPENRTLTNGLDVAPSEELRAFMLNRFRQQIESGQIITILKDCCEALSPFSQLLDWAYLDAWHLYPETLHQLRCIERAVKPTGLICGHDYDMETVRRSVTEFCEESGWKLLLVTNETSSTFVLHRPQYRPKIYLGDLLT